MSPPPVARFHHPRVRGAATSWASRRSSTPYCCHDPLRHRRHRRGFGLGLGPGLSGIGRVAALDQGEAAPDILWKTSSDVRPQIQHDQDEAIWLWRALLTPSSCRSRLAEDREHQSRGAVRQTGDVSGAGTDLGARFASTGSHRRFRRGRRGGGLGSLGICSTAPRKYVGNLRKVGLDAPSWSMRRGVRKTSSTIKHRLLTTWSTMQRLVPNAAGSARRRTATGRRQDCHCSWQSEDFLVKGLTSPSRGAR